MKLYAWILQTSSGEIYGHIDDGEEDKSVEEWNENKTRSDQAIGLVTVEGDTANALLQIRSLMGVDNETISGVIGDLIARSYKLGMVSQ